MTQPISLRKIEFLSVEVTDRTTWTFAVFHDAEGATSTVEITSGASTSAVGGFISAALVTISDTKLTDESEVVGLLDLTTEQLRADRVRATAISAVRTAIVDISAQREGKSITEYLGGNDTESVPLYANINRFLFGSPRAPQDFGAAAERAVSQGYAIVKCAPFDEVRPPSTSHAILDVARPGIERVAAIRSAVGPDVQVFVDCHSRFQVDTAPRVAEELAKLDIGWFEEPVQPTSEPDALASIAGQVSMPVAGGESGYGAEFFRELVRNG